MYLVDISYNNDDVQIHGEKEKLKSGSIVRGINTIDSFTFTMLPSNAGFNCISDLKTLVRVYDTLKGRYEFFGRVLYSRNAMDANGLITKECTCESFLGFLCDSHQPFVKSKEWTVEDLLTHLIAVHNSRMEEYKHFVVGEISAELAQKTVTTKIDKKKTWEIINSLLIHSFGGEIRFRVMEEVMYLDYYTEIGETKTTGIVLAKNMKAISQEKDPSAYITRLIPYGAKLTEEITEMDENGNDITTTKETGERLDITSVNNGIEYIEDEQAVERFGIIEGIVEYDEVTDALELLKKSRNYLDANNKVLIKYSITALDLSLLNLDIDDFDIYNRHPVKNSLLGIDDIARVIKKTIDVVGDNATSSIEVGDNFKTLSDIQVEQATQISNAISTIGRIEANYVTNQALEAVNKSVVTLIKQTGEQITMQVKELEGDLEKASTTANQTAEKFEWIVKSGTSSTNFTLTERMAELAAAIISLNADVKVNGEMLVNGAVSADHLATNAVTSKNYKKGSSGSHLNLADGSFDSPHLQWDKYGNLTATSGIFAGWTISASGIYHDFSVGELTYRVEFSYPTTASSIVLSCAKSSNGSTWEYTYRLRADGTAIHGSTHTIEIAGNNIMFKDSDGTENGSILSASGESSVAVTRLYGILNNNECTFECYPILLNNEQGYIKVENGMIVKFQNITTGETIT